MEIINTYLDMVAEAKKEYTDIEARYTKFADAEAYYINHAMVIPYGITGGGYQATSSTASRDSTPPMARPPAGIRGSTSMRPR